MKTKSVYGIYMSRDGADNAVYELQKAGFDSNDISVLIPADNVSKDALAPEKHTKAPEGLAVGATGGALIGGGLGLLAGLGSLAIPGVGPLIAAGPILAALTGMGFGGTFGGLAGALIGVGIPEYEAKRMEGFLKSGGILLSVHFRDEDWRDRAIDLLKRTGAQDISGAPTGRVSSTDDLSDEDYIARKRERDNVIDRTHRKPDDYGQEKSFDL